ncbi:MAG: hypothetical protein AUI12_18775 [Acidobacteria bacterium 13_2_20CM_2_57_6]|nr:MAG: hypothetical protein AUI12_18775 [Acidobacteria bacterium 13_2_20CM_2_57_6]PYT44864.1 MAG: hypothetical protein DMG47_09735 [Acidobacteriota bacterium]PYT44891.1 MAG: hypothetical protein DMG45_03270 [Acidobacteriota bacterium]PYT53335.1 MAG: hypothetical protein DMG46_24860 [Acidobacteriota bacterium]
MKDFSRSSNNVSAVVGVLLLMIPTYFVTMSALRYDASGLQFFNSPILILGTLAIAFALNARSILSLKLEREKPPVLKIALSLRVWNLVEILIALFLLGALLTYALVENFEPR